MRLQPHHLLIALTNNCYRTGASGYVGGQLLHELTKTHPEYNIVTLVRDIHAAETISQAYPKVRTVVGDLDDSELVEQEAGKADIVLSTWCHERCWWWY